MIFHVSESLFCVITSMFILKAATISAVPQAFVVAISSDGANKLTIPEAVPLFNSSTPDGGIKGLLVGSQPLNGCQDTAPSPPTCSTGDKARVLLVQRGGCNFSEKVRHAAKTGFDAVIIFDDMYARPISSAYLINSTKPEIPAFFVSFLDGGLLWKNFQCFTDSSVIIASKIIPNASLPAFTIGDRSTGVGDVMLGFIPTVSYVCIIVLLLLVIISRRFLHCSVYMCYKLATSRSKVVPLRQREMSETSSSGINSEMSSRCAICLESLVKNDCTRSRLPCQHTFHQICIDHWLLSGKLACPLCRSRITMSGILQSALRSHRKAKQTANVVILLKEIPVSVITRERISCGTENMGGQSILPS